MKSLSFKDEQGVIQGEWVDYNEDGKIKRSAKFVDGKLNGVETFFYSNGRKEVSVNYKAGQKNGTGYWYNSNGNLEQKAIFNNDIQIFLSLYDNQGKVTQISERIVQNERKLDKHLFYSNDKQTFEGWQDVVDSSLVYKFEEKEGAIYEHRTINVKKDGDDILVRYFGDKDVITQVKVYSLKSFARGDYDYPLEDITSVYTVSDDRVSLIDYYMAKKVGDYNVSYDLSTFGPNDEIRISNLNSNQSNLFVQFLTKREGFDTYNYEVLVNVE